MAGVSASWLLPLRSECDWLTAVPQWADFRLLLPLGRIWPRLFPDEGLACAVRRRDAEDD